MSGIGRTPLRFETWRVNLSFDQCYMHTCVVSSLSYHRIGHSIPSHAARSAYWTRRRTRGTVEASGALLNSLPHARTCALRVFPLSEGSSSHPDSTRLHMDRWRRSEFSCQHLRWFEGLMSYEMLMPLRRSEPTISVQRYKRTTPTRRVECSYHPSQELLQRCLSDNNMQLYFVFAAFVALGALVAFPLSLCDLYCATALPMVRPLMSLCPCSTMSRMRRNAETKVRSRILHPVTILTLQRFFRPVERPVIVCGRTTAYTSLCATWISGSIS